MRSWLARGVIAAGMVSAVVLGACPRVTHDARAPLPLPTRTFPALPRNDGEAEALIRASTHRAEGGRPVLDAAAILAAIADDTRSGALLAGNHAIASWLRASMLHPTGDLFVLFGGWHDAPGQLDAFRRLIGPGGPGGFTWIGLELFRADGEWSGVDATVQRGDDGALARYEGLGDPVAFDDLGRDRRAADYAAWKFGFEGAALDVVVTARAMGIPLRGCDMPVELQRATGLSHGDLLNRLREIHCVHSIPDDGFTTRRVALLWGDAHLWADGIGRFLPSSATVVRVHLVGQRIEPGDLEIDLGKGVAIAEPVLVPVRPDEAVLLLPDRALGASVERVASEEVAASEGNLVVRAVKGGTLSVGHETWRVPDGGEPLVKTIEATDATYAYSDAGRRVVGALHLARGRQVELTFDGEGGVALHDRKRR